MWKWIKQSNRCYHLVLGIVSALFGTLIGAIEVACAMEGKDCQYDSCNKDTPLYKWSFNKWDWLDFLATVLGGLVGQAIQVGILLIIL